jgi:hypothetical protein
LLHHLTILKGVSSETPLFLRASLWYLIVKQDVENEPNFTKYSALFYIGCNEHVTTNWRGEICIVGILFFTLQKKVLFI